MFMSRSRPATGIWSRLITGISFLLVSGFASADYAINFQTPATATAKDVLELHDSVFIVVFVIFILVFSVMFWSIVFHRKKRGYKAATFHDNTTLEVIWTIVPFFVLIGLAIPSTATVIKMYNTSDSDMTIRVTGHQWKWEYAYPEQGIHFMSTLSTPQSEIHNEKPKDKHYLLEVDHPLVIPVHKRIRFVITSADVIHSWWVPAFGEKKDAIPGYINEIALTIDKPGTYRGQCAELCGQGHGFMPIVVKAVSQEDFNKWANKEKGQMVAEAQSANRVWTKAELMKNGDKVYHKICAACHQPNGQGLPGVFPALAGSKVVNGPVSEHLKTVMDGRPGTAMAAFKNQLSDVDIASVVTYERNSFGNHTGDVIQPSQVKALR